MISALHGVLVVALVGAPVIDWGELLLPMRSSVTLAPTEELTRAAPAAIDALALAEARAAERDQNLQSAADIVGQVIVALQAASSALTDAARASSRATLVSLAEVELMRATQALLDALRLEGERLELLEVAMLEARLHGVTLAALDADLVSSLRRQAVSDRAAAHVRNQTNAYRDLALGLVAHLDGDAATALERLEHATKTAPQLPVAHVYHGSFCYLAGDIACARLAWMRALDLDPADETVRLALDNLEKGLDP